MPTEAYEKYGLPTRPEDPDAEYMTIQETAWVLKCSVSHARRLVKRTGLGSRPGRRLVTNKADRAALYEAQHAGGTAPARRKRRTPRKPSKPQSLQPAA